MNIEKQPQKIVLNAIQELYTGDRKIARDRSEKFLKMVFSDWKNAKIEKEADGRISFFGKTKKEILQLFFANFEIPRYIYRKNICEKKIEQKEIENIEKLLEKPSFPEFSIEKENSEKIQKVLKNKIEKIANIKIRKIISYMNGYTMNSFCIGLPENRQYGFVYIWEINPEKTKIRIDEMEMN